MFKKGDEVICIATKNSNHSLETGRVYRVVSQETQFLKVVDASGYARLWNTSRFVPNTPKGRAKWMEKKMEESNNVQGR